jgi:hypothetical protein
MLFLNFFYNSAQCETEQGGQVVRKPRIQEFKNSRIQEVPTRRDVSLKAELYFSE